jgi:hypothetical protein
MVAMVLIQRRSLRQRCCGEAEAKPVLTKAEASCSRVKRTRAKERAKHVSRQRLLVVRVLIHILCRQKSIVSRELHTWR